jgi:hypothetical protein
MKLATNVFVNSREAQQATYNVGQIKNSIISFFCVTTQNQLANFMSRDHPNPNI